MTSLAERVMRSSVGGVRCEWSPGHEQITGYEAVINFNGQTIGFGVTQTRDEASGMFERTRQLFEHARVV